MGTASFVCDSFHAIDTWRFSSLNENHKLMSLLAKIDIFDIFVSRIFQPTIPDKIFAKKLQKLQTLQRQKKFDI